MDFTSHSERTITRKLLRYSITITGPVSRAHKALGKDLGNIRPVRFVVEGIPKGPILKKIILNIEKVPVSILHVFMPETKSRFWIQTSTHNNDFLAKNIVFFINGATSNMTSGHAMSSLETGQQWTICV